MQRVAGQQATEPGAETEKRAASFLKLFIKKRAHMCLLDSGCDITVLPANLVAKDEIRPTEQRIQAANGTEIPVLGTTTLHAKIGHTLLLIEGLVSTHIFEPTLGIDWLKK